MLVHSPRRGLLVGLILLVVFASAAVAMTARGANPAPATAAATPATSFLGDDGGDRGRTFIRGGGGRR